MLTKARELLIILASKLVDKPKDLWYNIVGENKNFYFRLVVVAAAALLLSDFCICCCCCFGVSVFPGIALLLLHRSGSGPHPDGVIRSQISLRIGIFLQTLSFANHLTTTYQLDRVDQMLITMWKTF